MGRKKNSHFSFLLVLLICTALFLKSAKSEEYVVGDEEEWNSQGNFLAWSEKYNFSVGDVLVFKYVKGQHNVYEVEEKTYRSCNSSSGVLAKYESGNDRINLTEAKKYWFICDVEGHCLGGMRFGIEVKRSSRSSGGSDPPSLQPREEIPAAPPPTSSCDLMSEIGVTGIFVLAFWLLFKLH